VAQGTKESSRFANNSNTGGTNFWNAIVNGAPFGAAAFDPVTGAGLLGASITIQGVSGLLLSSPKFARWLAKAPKQQTPAAQRAHIANLSRIAANDNVIAADAMNLQQQLMARMEGGAAGLAAEDQDTGAGSNTTGPGRQ
jgi:hypothetical protein